METKENTTDKINSDLVDLLARIGSGKVKSAFIVTVDTDGNGETMLMIGVGPSSKTELLGHIEVARIRMVHQMFENKD